MLNPTTIVYCGINPYESLRQRPQWLADGLTAHAHVLYIDPHRSVLGGAPMRKALKRHTERLAILRPPGALPVTGYVRLLNIMSWTRTARAVHQALDELRWGVPSAMLVSFPKHVDFVHAFSCQRVVYDVMDDYPHFFDRVQSALLARMHRELLASASAVVTSSKTLADRYASFARNGVEIIGNGVSHAFIEACSVAEPAPELACLPRPVLGYVGTIASWFDFEAVARLARAFSHGTVVLIGPAEVRLPTLPDNVRWLGPRPHSSLPSLLRAFDLGLIPFRLTALTDAINPVKVYEYLAAGLPVLGTSFAELSPFGSLVRAEPSARWAVAALDLLAATASRERRVAAARRERWEDRAQRLWQVLIPSACNMTTTRPG